QALGNLRAEHLVNKELHEARKRSRSRAARWARSAAASLLAIVVLTSSGYAAVKETAACTSRSDKPSYVRSARR
ncbi:MAG: hypothetical protein M3467_06250, partial [Actinomycetota bacterium]|nr:hypothetical protein [Actinomycetota bacterium]